MMSASWGGVQPRMSCAATWTRPDHPSDGVCSRLRRTATAHGFFSTAITSTFTPITSAAPSTAATSGPRPAPSTITHSGRGRRGAAAASLAARQRRTEESCSACWRASR
jgi:hypothetical protein